MNAPTKTLLRTRAASSLASFRNAEFSYNSSLEERKKWSVSVFERVVRLIHTLGVCTLIPQTRIELRYWGVQSPESVLLNLDIRL